MTQGEIGMWIDAFQVKLLASNSNSNNEATASTASTAEHHIWRQAQETEWARRTSCEDGGSNETTLVAANHDSQGAVIL